MLLVGGGPTSFCATPPRAGLRPSLPAERISVRGNSGEGIMRGPLRRAAAHAPGRSPMYRTLGALALFASLIACSRGGGCKPDPGADEYAVYSSAIEELKGVDEGGTVVIKHAADAASETAEYVGRCEALVPEGGRSLLESFRESNRHPLELARGFTLKGDYLLQPEGDLKTIPPERMRAEGLRAKYPDAYGVVSLSRVGFDAGATRALVYVSRVACGLGCGEGVCMLLVKEDCRWKVSDRRRSWIS